MQVSISICFLSIFWLCSLDAYFLFALFLGRSLMSYWKQRRTLRHLAWKWGRPLVRPREEQTPGLAVCTADSLLLSPSSSFLYLRRIWNSTWCGSNKQLRAKPKNKNCNYAECSMLIVLWNFGLTSIADYLLFLLQE